MIHMQRNERLVGFGLFVCFLRKVQVGIAASTSVPALLQTLLWYWGSKSAVSWYIFLWSATKMFAELVISDSAVQPKNGVCFFFLSEAEVAGLGYEENTENF